jgi:O-antigen/teichoic acid export membrane protein
LAGPRRTVAQRSGSAHAIVEFAVFMASSAAFQASRLGVNLLAAALLDPASFGLWSIVVTVMTYTTYGNLGVTSGANRQIPLKLGGRQHNEASATEGAALAGALSAGGVLAALTLVAAAVVGGRWTGLALPVALAIGLQQIYLFYQVSLRARLDFNKASVHQGLLALGFPAIGVPLLVLVGLPGLALAQAIAYGVGSLIVAVAWRPSLRPVVDWHRIVALAGDGFPIMLSGLAFSALASIDRWVVLGWGGEELLGHYALASTLSGSMMFVSLLVAMQFYPRIAVRHGAGETGRELFGVAVRQSALSALLVLPIALVIIAGAPLAVPAFFPRYVEAIGALRVLAVGYVVLAAASGFTNLLVTIGRAWLNLLSQVAVTAFAAVATTGALRFGLGLDGVAGAMLLAFSVFVAISIALARLAIRA